MFVPAIPVETATARKARQSSSPPSSPAWCWKQIQTTVALTFAVPLAELQAPTRRSNDAAFARQVSMYMARTVLRLSYVAIGRLCHRDHKTVAHACRLIEQHREDPAINGTLRAVEALCESLVVHGAPRSERRRA